MSTNLSGLTTIADRIIKPQLRSGLFNKVPTLAILAGRGGNPGDIGRPGVFATIGGKGRLSAVKRQVISDGYDKHIRYLTGRVGGGKYLGVQDSTASTGSDTSDKKPRSATFRWCMRQQPIKVRKMVKRVSAGKAAIVDATMEAAELALEELLETLATDVHTGTPTDQTDEVWDAPAGLHSMSHTTNTYGGENRSTQTAWQGKRVTTATAATLDLIDDANFTQGAADTGPGVDLCVTTNAIYLTLKKEALARDGARVVNLDDVPEMAKLGFKREAIQYGNALIIADPQQTASYFHALVASDLFFDIHPDENFRVTKFVDGEELAQGSEDVFSAHLNLMFRMYAENPWYHVLYTNVS